MQVFVDATHVKTRINKKIQRRSAHYKILFYEEILRKEIDTDRAEHENVFEG